MKQKKNFINIILLIFFLTSCRSDFDFTKEYMSNYRDIAFKKIEFSMNLLKYNNINTTNDFFNKGNKILCTANSDCSPCAITLEEIEEYLQENKDLNIKVIVIFAGEKSDYLDYQIKKKNYSFPIFYDIENNFIKINKLENYTKAFFLLSEENKILLTGNPFQNKELKKHYTKLLSN